MERRSWKYLLLAGLLAAAATLIKYPGLVVLGVFAVAGVQRREPRVLVPILLPLAALVAWLRWSGALYGAGQIDQASSFLVRFGGGQWRFIVERLLSMAVVLAMTFPVWILSLVVGRSRLWAILPAAAATLAGWLFLPPACRNAPGMTFVVLAAMFLGVFSVAEALCTAFRFREDRADVRWVALVWILGTISVTAVGAPFVAVRYLLPLHPPLALLIFRSPLTRFGRAATTRTVAVCLGLSALLAWTDFRWAAVYPTFVNEIRDRFAGRTVYFTGHWGWQWYAEQAGFQAWDARTIDAPAGSVLLIAQRADPTPFHEAIARRLRQIDERTVPAHPLRLTTWCFLRSSPIWYRFYGGNYPHLPWGLTSEPTERFLVFEVGP
jgi:hypothetical protein